MATQRGISQRLNGLDPLHADKFLWNPKHLIVSHYLCKSIYMKPNRERVNGNNPSLVGLQICSMPLSEPPANEILSAIGYSRSNLLSAN